MASRAGQSYRPRPVVRQVKQGHLIDGQNARRCVPIPVLPIDNFQPVQKLATSEPPSLVVVEERFVFRNDIVVMSCRSTHR